MARIRTIKPEFFTSEDIIDLDPLARLLYIALWCEADREGRLSWKPRTFKIRYLPEDECDIDVLCDALLARGMLVLYADDLAFIPSFHKHQHVNPREKASTLPVPTDDEILQYSRESDASVTCREERKGKERKGKELKDLSDASHQTSEKKEVNPLNKKTNEAYSTAFFERHKTEPVWNAKMHSQIAQLVKRLGEDSPHVAAFYVSHNDTWYVRKMHSLDGLVKDAESLRAQWAIGKMVTDKSARDTQKFGNLAGAINDLYHPDEDF